MVLYYIFMDTVVTHPSWVRRDGIVYKNNNAYVIVDSDGLKPVHKSTKF